MFLLTAAKGLLAVAKGLVEWVGQQAPLVTLAGREAKRKKNVTYFPLVTHLQVRLSYTKVNSEKVW